MSQLTQAASIRAAAVEAQLRNSGKQVGAISYDPETEKIYLGDAREYIENDDWLVDVPAFKQSKILGASGDLDKANSLRVFSEKYLGMYEDFVKIDTALENVFMPYQKIIGAAGTETTSRYENIRRAGQLLANVTGQQYLLEEYQAMNIATVVRSSDLNFEYFRKISDKNIIQKEMSDDAIPDDVRAMFTDGKREIYPDGTSVMSSNRDKNTKINVIDEITKEFPGAFALAKNEKVIDVVNALPGNNQGDWGAVSGNFPDIMAAEEVQIAQDAVKQYGQPLITLMNSDSWRYYVNNFGGSKDPRPANVSTSEAGQKSGILQGNPSVRYYIDDAITSESYVLAAQSAFMKFFLGPVVQTSFKDERTAGQMEQRFFFDHNGVEVTEPNAAFRATTVGS